MKWLIGIFVCLVFVSSVNATIVPVRIDAQPSWVTLPVEQFFPIDNHQMLIQPYQIKSLPTVDERLHRCCPPEVPEPATVVILSAGCVFLMRRKRKYAR